jgi:hypothetical protein
MRAAVMIGLLALGVVPGVGFSADKQSEAEQALGLIRSWVTGRYDNSTQATRDLDNPAVPDEQKHRLMHQLFVPVTVAVPSIPGYLVFQQSSVDGSENPETIIRAGLLQFFVDEGGTVHQRELNFRDLDAFKNAHRDPDRPPSGDEISGPMKAGACRMFSQGLNKELIADDAVTIRPDEYWFLGRFVDETGAVVWGNASPEPVKMLRLPAGTSLD